MYRSQDGGDLRNEIYHLKKQLLNVNAENQLLKVKVRKLQDESNKKDRQIDAILDPTKSPHIRQIFYEKSASFLINMREKNDKLQKAVSERDNVIKRLQNQLEMAKLYSRGPRRQFQCKCEEVDGNLKQVTLKVPGFKNNSTSLSQTDLNKEVKRSRSFLWSPGLQSRSVPAMDFDPIMEENEKEKQNNFDMKDQYRGLSRDHLLSIIESLKNSQRYSPTSRQASRKSSPESDLDRIELFCESPHEEIQQLHFHFLEMITEVDQLKNTIFQLQNDQQNTENVLKNKDTSIGKLAKEIKNLKRPPKLWKNRSKSANNNTVLKSIYSSSSSKSDNNNRKHSTNNKKSNLKNSKATKDVMTQIEEENEFSPKYCSYIERDSIVITKKTATSQTSLDKDDQEKEYEDEVFDECDSESLAIN